MPPPAFARYWYSATVKRVVDGDTVDLAVDCGFGITSRQRVRLRGIDAPEMRGVPNTAPGIAAHAHLASILTSGLEVRIQTHLDRRDKYSRLLAEIWTPGVDDLSVSERMVGAGHAVAYFP